MWVDRYRPTKFTDLLGDEVRFASPDGRPLGTYADGLLLPLQRVNRETMSWLKEWDQCVFKRKPPRVKKRGMEDADKDGINFNPDPLGRPKEKVSLHYSSFP